VNRFVNAVRRDVPGCPNPLIKDEVLEAGIAFCRRTSIYTHDCEVVLSAGDTEVVPVLPENTALVGVNYINVNGVTDYEPIVANGRILFNPAVSSNYSALINMALKPTRLATCLPDVLYNDFFQEICSGAKAKLMIMPEKSWSNPQLAMVHSAAFDSGVGKATRKAFYANMPQERRAERRQWL